ncbi:helix-turn-helix domain-containing protein [Mucilaginibacter conchicola]|uniref:Helix-turn-helix domain-containing protein n=1 Tax=Mucilaginibacter conchicola TaxID=2303333 RepID=A0A372NQ17_9SPHI|nr:helix-turn-helix domain-containing protein [Mucilaginibacter conchicola]RFZ90958.1 helix-turn-helix domain-containing protein [Mucilaginibacter conchicola]
MLTEFPLHQLPPVQFLASDKSPAFGEHATEHRINFYAIVWFQEDGGTHYLDFEAYPIRKDTVFLIGKNQVHSIPSAVLPRSKTIVFSREFFEQIEEPFLRQLFSPFHNQGIALPADKMELMNSLFSLIMQESNHLSDTSLLLKYTTAFLTHLFRFSKADASSAEIDDTRMLKLFQLIEENYKENRSALFYASQIGLTPKRVNEILRQRAGTTMNKLIEQLLLIEAKRGLMHHRSSVKEIAYDLGYSDPSYFARFFKKHTGLTPEQFKASEPAGFVG